MLLQVCPLVGEELEFAQAEREKREIEQRLDATGHEAGNMRTARS